MNNATQIRRTESSADIYCPLCTHTVTGTVILAGKIVKVKPGQKCSHCHSSLDAGYVFGVKRAA